MGKRELSRQAVGRDGGVTGEAGKVGWGHIAQDRNVIPRRLAVS